MKNNTPKTIKAEHFEKFIKLQPKGNEKDDLIQIHTLSAQLCIRIHDFVSRSLQEEMDRTHIDIFSPAANSALVSVGSVLIGLALSKLEPDGQLSVFNSLKSKIFDIANEKMESK